jgi:hypothetical protein
VGIADEITNQGRPAVQLGKLAELLERAGIDLATVSRVKTVKAWQGFFKDAAGEAHTVDMHGIEFVPTFADGPQWPVVQPGPVVKLARPPRRLARGLAAGVGGRPVRGW